MSNNSDELITDEDSGDGDDFIGHLYYTEI